MPFDQGAGRTIEMCPGPQAYSSILISCPFPASVSVHLSLIQCRRSRVCLDSVSTTLAKLSL